MWLVLLVWLPKLDNRFWVTTSLVLIAILLLRSSFSFALLAVGQIKSSDVRQKLAHTVSSHGFSFPVVVASTAVISRHAVIGAGTVVGHHAMVNAGASVGEHCIINTGSLLNTILRYLVSAI